MNSFARPELANSSDTFMKLVILTPAIWNQKRLSVNVLKLGFEIRNKTKFLRLSKSCDFTWRNTLEALGELRVQKLGGLQELDLRFRGGNSMETGAEVILCTKTPAVKRKYGQLNSQLQPRILSGNPQGWAS